MKNKKITKQKAQELWKRWSNLPEDDKRTMFPRLWGWMEAVFESRPQDAKEFYRAMEDMIRRTEKENQQSFLGGLFK